MMLTTYVKFYAAARHNDPCTVCGQSVLAEPIYWHGYGGNDPVRGVRGHHGLATHAGCFWDCKNGPAPHLTWRQIEAINNAVVGRNKSSDPKAQRFLDAVAIALRERNDRMYGKDDDAGMRLGPNLVDGYGMVLARLDSPGNKFWRLREAGGGAEWADPHDRKPAEPAHVGTNTRGYYVDGSYTIRPVETTPIIGNLPKRLVRIEALRVWQMVRSERVFATAAEARAFIDSRMATLREG